MKILLGVFIYIMVGLISYRIAYILSGDSIDDDEGTWVMILFAFGFTWPIGIFGYLFYLYIVKTTFYVVDRYIIKNVDSLLRSLFNIKKK